MVRNPSIKWLRSDGPSKGTAVDTTTVPARGGEGELDLGILSKAMKLINDAPSVLFEINICEDPDCEIVREINKLPVGDEKNWMTDIPIVKNSMLFKNSALFIYTDGKVEMYMKHRLTGRYFIIDMGQKLCLKHLS